MRKSSKISMKSFYLLLLLFILLLSGCNCWDIAEGELEHDGGHTIWRIKNPKDTSIYDAVADTETYDVVDASGLEDVEDTGLDVEEMMDYKADLGVDVIDIGDSDQFDVEDGGGDVIEDVWDGGWDGGDISDVGDVCIPDCNGKECGSDGCGGVCGVCGMSAYCSNFKCICNTGYANCDNDWGNGCEIYLNSVKSCGTSCEDITNCGTNGECVFGVCKCKGMYGNCDGSWSNGCETNLTNDVDNCGGCGRVCNNPPLDYCLNLTTLRDYTGVSSCQNSQCVYEYQDINCPNGCANGRCQSCTPSCAGKECGPDGCGGSCGSCGTNATCSNSSCVCNPGYANCDSDWSNGCEVNLNSINSCGTSCSNKVVCSSSNGTNPVCDNGVCKLTCNSGYADCNSGVGSSDGCEVNLNSPSTCGTSCGNITNCGQNSDCKSGNCKCIYGFVNCDYMWDNGCEGNLEFGGRNIRVTNYLGGSWSPSIVWTGSEFAVAWDDYRDGAAEIYFVILSKDGNKIGDDIRITNSPGDSWEPTLLFNGYEFAIIWKDKRNGVPEIYFTRVSKSGIKVDKDIRVSTITDYIPFDFDPVSAVWTGSSYALCWQDNRDGYLKNYLVLLSDKGEKISNEISITNGGGQSMNPSVVWNGEDFGMVWQNNIGAQFDIYYASISKDLSYISDIKNISNSPNDSSHPLIAWTGSEYGVVWEEVENFNNIIYFLTLSRDGAKTIDKVKVSDSLSLIENISFIWNGSEFGIFWHDNRDGGSNIYFSRMTRSGVRINDIKISNGISSSNYRPSAIWEGTTYGVVWDNRDVDEIYFSLIGCN